ncbi:MAG: hypothetical protein V5A34_11250 [Halapricum sp.]
MAAPLAFVLLQAVQVVIAPIPGQVLALASGWLFGLVWGTVYSIIGATLGSYTAGCNHVKNFATPGGEYFHEVTAGSITWPSGWQGGTADRSSSVRSIQLRSIGSTISRLGGAM